MRLMIGTAASTGSRAARTRIASIGVKACARRRPSASAWSTAAGISAAEARRACAGPALWPSGTALIAACTMFSAQPEAKASSDRRAPARRWRRRRARRRPARSAPAQRLERRAGAARAARRWLQPLRQRAAHLLGLLAQLARLARAASTQALSAATRARSSSRQAATARPTTARSARARGVRRSWSASQSRGVGLVATRPRSTAASRPSE